MGPFDDLLKLKGGNLREGKIEEAGGRPKRPGPK
jgi:hypothetical protein